MTQTIDWYLRTMKRYLPRAERDDIAAELSANIYAEVEDEERRLGRPLTVAECSGMLEAYGHPIAVALRYSGNSRSFTFGWQIVGPELFPSYVWILAFNVLVVCGIVGAEAIFRAPKGTGMPNVFAPLFIQFAVVTAVFAALQAAISGRIDASVGVPRLRSFCALVFTLGANVAIFEVIGTRDVAAESGGVLMLAPAWHNVMVTYVLFVLVELARNAVNLYRPNLRRFRAISIIVGGTVALVGCAMALGSGAIVAAIQRNDAAAVRFASDVTRTLDVCFASAAAIATATIAWQVRVLFRRRTRAARTIPFALLGLAIMLLGGGAEKAEARCVVVAPFAIHAGEPPGTAGAPMWHRTAFKRQRWRRSIRERSALETQMGVRGSSRHGPGSLTFREVTKYNRS